MIYENSVLEGNKKMDINEIEDEFWVEMEMGNPAAANIFYSKLLDLGDKRFNEVGIAMAKKNPRIIDILSLGHEKSLEYLEAILKNTEPSDTYSHENAAEVLKRIGAIGVDLAEKFFQQTNPEARTILVSLMFIHTRNIFSILSTILKDERNMSRPEIIRGIYLGIMRIGDNKLSNEQEKILQIIQNLINDKDRSVRLESFVLLGRSSRLSRDEFFKWSEDIDLSVRKNFVDFLFSRKLDEKTTDGYINLLEDSVGEVVQECFNLLEKEWRRINPDEAINSIFDILVERKNGKPDTYFNPSIVAKFLSLLDRNYPHTNTDSLIRLRDLAINNNGGIRRRAISIAKIFAVNEFIDMVIEIKKEKPNEVNELLQYFRYDFKETPLYNQISKAEPGNIQENAAIQIQLLANYHENGLKQARTSFIWAIIISIAGFLSLLISIGFLISSSFTNIVAIIAAIGSCISQFISYTLLNIYREAMNLLTYYHRQMNRTQSFLLANSLCEMLNDENKEKSRMDLIKDISIENHYELKTSKGKDIV